jgi:hypothetical protein
MPIILPLENSQEFELTPSGSHVAVSYRVIDLGTQLVEYKGERKQQRKIMLSWELCDEFMKEGKNEGLPFSIHKRYTFSSHEKSTLRKDLESWRGKPFTTDDFGKFDIGVLIGIGCMLSVVHAERNGKTYANISSIMRLPKGIAAKTPVNPTVYFSLDSFDQLVFDELSDSLKTIIMASPEYQKIKGGYNSPNVSDDHDDTPNDDISF